MQSADGIAKLMIQIWIAWITFRSDAMHPKHKLPNTRPKKNKDARQFNLNFH